MKETAKDPGAPRADNVRAAVPRTRNDDAGVTPASPQGTIQQMADASPRHQAERAQSLAARNSGRSAHGGMPLALAQGIHALSGHDLSDVQVMRNSAKPRQFGALGFAMGNEIHLESGQEVHLAHEAWHVVQQRQGRVMPAGEIGGVKVNQDRRLEDEAEAMGGAALDRGRQSRGTVAGAVPAQAMGGISPVPAIPVMQRVLEVKGKPVVSMPKGLTAPAQEIFADGVDDEETHSFASAEALRNAIENVAEFEQKIARLRRDVASDEPGKEFEDLTAMHLRSCDSFMSGAIADRLKRAKASWDEVDKTKTMFADAQKPKYMRAHPQAACIIIETVELLTNVQDKLRFVQDTLRLEDLPKEKLKEAREGIRTAQASRGALEKKLTGKFCFKPRSDREYLEGALDRLDSWMTDLETRAREIEEQLLPERLSPEDRVACVAVKEAFRQAELRADRATVLVHDMVQHHFYIKDHWERYTDVLTSAKHSLAEGNEKLELLYSRAASWMKREGPDLIKRRGIVETRVEILRELTASLNPSSSNASSSSSSSSSGSTPLLEAPSFKDAMAANRRALEDNKRTRTKEREIDEQLRSEATGKLGDRVDNRVDGVIIDVAARPLGTGVAGKAVRAVGKSAVKETSARSRMKAYIETLDALQQPYARHRAGLLDTERGSRIKDSVVSDVCKWAKTTLLGKIAKDELKQAEEQLTGTEKVPPPPEMDAGAFESKTVEVFKGR